MPEPSEKERPFYYIADDAPPPVGGTWTRLYIFVLLLHAFIIFLFYLFTHAHS
jgi:hypothetical protein